MIDYRVEDGLAVLSWNLPDRSMNVINEASLEAYAAALETAVADPQVTGIIVTSAKDSFLAGADLAMVKSAAFGAKDPDILFQRLGALQRLFRRQESCGKPVVAAINGTALGGGLELCLAAHYRIAADTPKAELGLPEVKVGLLPGGGGTQRLPRLIGLQPAMQAILKGTSFSPQDALGMKIIDEVVPAAELLDRAKAYLKGSPRSVQPWDERGFKIPGGAVQSPSGFQTFTMGNAIVVKETFGNYPAAKAIMSCFYEGLQVGIDAGLQIETRYFTSLILDPVAGNMIRTLFVNMQDLNKGARRPKNEPKTEVRKLGILGAGMMGAGIAYVSSRAGIDCVLLDTTLDAAEKGKAYSAGLLDKAMSRGKATAEQREAQLARIRTTSDYADLAGCDLVIEAVFEDRAIKTEVTRKAEAVLGPDAVFASNTSTLPITGLAEISRDAASFIGIHFFSPVDKMMLVEIIMGAKTGSRALAVAMDYVQTIRKTPIVVNDSRGFYTSRCFSTYVSEGIEMLAEGIAPAIIDNVGRAAGMPRGPLEMNDDIALDLGWKIRSAARKDLGEAYEVLPGEAIVEAMVVRLGRYGRKNGKGFYDYPQGAKKTLWPGLAELAPVRVAEADPALAREIRTRLLYRQAVEAARCYAEGVVTDIRDADVGAILAWGFAPWSGGPLSLIDTVGVARFVAECDALAARFGNRYAPPQLLRDMARDGRSFYGEADVRAAAE